MVTFTCNEIHNAKIVLHLLETSSSAIYNVFIHLGIVKWIRDADVTTSRAYKFKGFRLRFCSCARNRAYLIECNPRKTSRQSFELPSRELRKTSENGLRVGSFTPLAARAVYIPRNVEGKSFFRQGRNWFEDFPAGDDSISRNCQTHRDADVSFNYHPGELSSLIATSQSRVLSKLLKL